jgi:hypothetical protein
MGLVISKGLTLRKGWQPMDPDAAAYITAVETADGHRAGGENQDRHRQLRAGLQGRWHLERHQGKLHPGWCSHSAWCVDPASRHCSYQLQLRGR